LIKDAGLNSANGESATTNDESLRKRFEF